MKLLDRKVVEETAKIIGRYSGSAQALKDAENYDDPVFIRVEQLNTIVVTERNTWENMKNEAT